jgi:hypothetical protein
VAWAAFDAKMTTAKMRPNTTALLSSNGFLSSRSPVASPSCSFFAWPMRRNSATPPAPAMRTMGAARRKNSGGKISPATTSTRRNIIADAATTATAAEGAMRSSARAPRHRERHGRGRREASHEAGHREATPGPEQAARDVAGEAHGAHEEDHLADLLRVDGAEWAVGLVGEERQHDDRDDEELQRGEDVLEGDAADGRVQARLDGQQRGDHHGERARREQAVLELGDHARRREPAEEQRDHGGDLGGEAALAQIGAKAEAVRAEEQHEPEHDGGEQPRERVGEHRRERARERDERKRPDAAGEDLLALALHHRHLPLEPHEEPDGEGDGQ